MSDRHAQMNGGWPARRHPPRRAAARVGAVSAAALAILTLVPLSGPIGTGADAGADAGAGAGTGATWGVARAQTAGQSAARLAGETDAPAGHDAIERATRASQALRAAADQLAAARKASDRTAALARTIRAYEDALVVMRDALREAAVREHALRLRFQAQREQLSRLVVALQTIERSPRPLFLVHPQGPVGAARAAMILGDLAPELNRRAETLRARLSELEVLRSIRASALDDLEAGLAGAQAARVALAEAVARRTDLPRRLAADPEAMRHLLESSDTLEGFAAGLAATAPATQPPAPGGERLDLGTPAGQLPLPVGGAILRRFMEQDAAGVQRPGLILTAAPLSVVTNPVTATVRYAGPLLDYGNVIILEPAPDFLIVLAGLSEVYGQVGQVLPGGEPVGLLAGKAPASVDFLVEAGQDTGASRQETLYIEIRQNGQAVDPEPWFALHDR